jgi:hypothetical protein
MPPPFAAGAGTGADETITSSSHALAAGFVAAPENAVIYTLNQMASYPGVSAYIVIFDTSTKMCKG